MDQTTLTALQASIAHWERLRDGKTLPDEGIGGTHCALCQAFLQIGSFTPSCEGCPVKEGTGFRYCNETPYLEAARAYGLNGPTSLEFSAAASDMVDFLTNLLPTGGAQ